MRFTKLIAFLVLLCAPMVFAQVVPAVCGFVASDNFTRANASSLGSNWTGSGYSISSNKAYPSVAFAQVYYSGSTFTANQCSSVQVAAWDTGNYPGVAVRVQASAEKGYYAYCATASGPCSSIKLVKATASGSYTTEETISSLSLAPGGTLTVVATGTSSPVSVSVYWNGSQIGTTFSDSSSPYTSGYPGMMTDYSSSATYGATYWEGDNYQTPACAVPTSNWPAGILLTQQNIALTSPSCTICYTTDGSTPTETGNACSGGTTQTYTAAVASASSGSWTLKALATAPGYIDSTVVTLAYTVAPSDVPIISDNFASYENANLEANQTQQLPLDAIQTVGNWTAWGGISGDLGASAECPADAIAPVRNGYQAPAVSGNATCGGTGAVSTARTGYSTSQYSKAYIVGAPGGVMTNATTGGSSYQLKLNTCASSGVNIYLYKYVSGTPTTLLSSTGQSVACGSTIELRSANGGLQPLINGAAPPGFASAIYQDSTLTGGQPGITGKISDWSAGNVGVADGTSVATYTPTYPTYTDTFPSTWALGWPEFQMDIHTGVSGPTWPQWNSPLSAALVSGSTYGLSLTHEGDAQISWRGGSFGPTGQYQIFSPAVDPTNIGFNWYFGELQMNPWVPGTTGGCATAGTTASCFDIVAYYVGVEYVGASRGAIGTPISITNKLEYDGTPFLHITKVTPASSAGDQVLTVTGTTYTPRPGDLIYEEYLNNGELNVACKGNASNLINWAASTAYTVGTYRVDSNGNWQVVTTLGTSGSTAPTWGTAWGTSDATLGQFTTDNTVTWMYAGNPCPTTSKYSWVINVIDSDLMGQKGTPGLGIQAGNYNSSLTGIPIFYSSTAGTANSTTACTMDSNLCGLGQQPDDGVIMGRVWRGVPFKNEGIGQ